MSKPDAACTGSPGMRQAQGLQEVTQVVAEEVKGGVPGILQGILQRGGGINNV